MDFGLVEEYLVDFQKNKLPLLVKRDLFVPDSSKVKIVVGFRRSGKTFFLFQKMRELIKKGVGKESIVFLNFEDPKLLEINFKEFSEVIKLHWKLFPSSLNQKLFLFIDEPQNIDNWEHAVRSLHDKNFNIFLSGSSSKLLSKEIASSLRGRSLSFLLLPFSFKEFLKFKKQEFDLERLSSKEKSKLESLLLEFVDFGSMPETIGKDKDLKLKILSEYLELVVFKDIIERNKLKNTKLVKWLINSIISSFSKEISIHKLFLTLKSRGIKVSKNTLYSYFSMIEDSFFVFSLPLFNTSVRKQELLKHKIFLIDTGFSNLIDFRKNIGRKMENIVFLELKRRQKTSEKIFYYKTQNNHEVDFVIMNKNKVTQLIQVSKNINNIETLKRETRALIQASEKLKCNKLLIITENTEKEIKEKWFNKTRKIKLMPLWKWLLN